MSGYQFGEREWHDADDLIARALAEDLGTGGDITSTATIPSRARGSARILARSAGVLAGLPIIERMLARFELLDQWEPLRTDGDRLEPGTVIARVGGPMRSLLSMERTALNFLQHLSGIASLTAAFVAAVADTRAAIYDTRKTTPGWRSLEKYAVRCGGGRNHRFGLFDAILIKDNHLAWLEADDARGVRDPISAAIAVARANAPAGTTVEIEVDSLEQLYRALLCGPDIILVDNFEPARVGDAVRLRNEVAPRVQLEASGGVNLANVRAFALTGVDRISVGVLTHSAPALDLAIDFAAPLAHHEIDVADADVDFVGT
jgi:nicotinate-nucleotide pyrophosphorylase (carboxylating)